MMIEVAKFAIRKNMNNYNSLNYNDKKGKAIRVTGREGP
jgi:hypothetical protein